MTSFQECPLVPLMLLSKVKSSFNVSLDNPLHILKTSIIKILPIPSTACKTTRLSPNTFQNSSFPLTTSVMWPLRRSFVVSVILVLLSSVPAYLLTYLLTYLFTFFCDLQSNYTSHHSSIINFQLNLRFTYYHSPDGASECGSSARARKIPDIQAGGGSRGVGCIARRHRHL